MRNWRQWIRNEWEFIKHTFRSQRLICEHKWRPCVVELHDWNRARPARICCKCHNWELLSDEEFFAQFGESFLSLAKMKIRPPFGAPVERGKF